MTLADVDVATLVRGLRKQKDELLQITKEAEERGNDHPEAASAAFVLAALEDAFQHVLGGKVW